MAIDAHLKQYLRYVKHTNGHATVEVFDDDWEPIGPRVRADLIPQYVVVNDDGKLILTAEGEAEFGR